MTYDQFIALLSSQAGADPGSRERLQALLRESPYCQTARMLYARTAGAEGLSDPEKRLAAVYAGDRKILQQLLEAGKQVAEKSSAVVAVDALETANETAPVTEGSVFLRPAESELLRAAPPQPVFHDEPAESVFRPAMAEEQHTPPPAPPVAPAFVPGQADPHDIIRRRLEEIFAAKPAPSVPDVPPPVESAEPAKEIPVPEPIITSAAEAMSEADAVAVTPPPAERGEEIPGDREEVVIRKEFMQLKDEVDRQELAHVAEESILHNLESLPVQEEKETFYRWLKRKTPAPYGTLEEVHASPAAITLVAPGGSNLPEKEATPSSAQLIERFIATDPRIVPSKTEFYSPAVQARRSVEEDDDLVSETLAAIYLEQGLLAKARMAYEKLSLLYPEKSSSFAALIKKIDTLNTEE